MSSSQQHAQRPSNEERIDDVVRGMMYASLSITDDKEATLATVGKSGPWHVEALKLITGNEELAHRTLTEILKECCHLTVDHHMDISGMTKGGHFLDTQGYIAHNDDVIVIAYRCTTSAFDWMTNFNATSSAWELDEDLEQGFSGHCSGFVGWNCCGGSAKRKPRVHTGFYNNVLASIPLIKEHVDPLLAVDQPPRKLYVTGHSLGAGIATLAACYFLLEYDWNVLPHTFINVTAGSPRSVFKSMLDLTNKRRDLFGNNKVRLYRMVRGVDVVSTVPPHALGFRHMGDIVYINEDGKIAFKDDAKNSNNKDTSESNSREVTVAETEDYVKQYKSAMNTTTTTSKVDEDDTDHTDKERKDDDKSPNVDGEEGEEQQMSKYEALVAKIPRPFRDHMPDFYLRPLFSARGIVSGIEVEEQRDEKRRTQSSQW